MKGGWRQVFGVEHMAIMTILVHEYQTLNELAWCENRHTHVLWVQSTMQSAETPALVDSKSENGGWNSNVQMSRLRDDQCVTIFHASHCLYVNPPAKGRQYLLVTQSELPHSIQHSPLGGLYKVLMKWCEHQKEITCGWQTRRIRVDQAFSYEAHAELWILLALCLRRNLGHAQRRSLRHVLAGQSLTEHNPVQLSYASTDWHNVPAKQAWQTLYAKKGHKPECHKQPQYRIFTYTAWWV